MFWLLAEATEVASSSIDATTVGVIIASVLTALGIGGAAGKKLASPTHVTNDPLNVKPVQDFVTRREHDSDIRDIRLLVRESETRAHARMDIISTKLDRLIGLVEGLNQATFKPKNDDAQ